MSRMGKHSPPIDGVAVANGHPVTATPDMVPLTMPYPLQVRGPAPVLPPQRAASDPDAPAWWRRALAAAWLSHRAWLAAVPVALVNAVAFSGQLSFLRGHLPWILAGQILVAVTLESVAVYLAWQAHLALAADDSALRLRLAAYGFAAVIGIMNYSHYMAAHWRPTFAAVTFGLMSVSSPWLWSVHSRRVSRDALKARGLIEPHAVRLGATRWMWHPWRCVRVMSRATWQGENDPAKAIALPAVKTAQASAEMDIEPDAEADTPAAVPVDIEPPAEADIEVDIEAPAPVDIIPDMTAPKVTPAKVDKPKPAARTSKRTPTAAEKVAAVLRRNPDLSNVEVARRAGVSAKTVQRARSDPAKASP